MRISDWSSDVCSSDLERRLAADTARIGIATADLYPRISLGGSGSFLRNQDVRGSNSLSFSVGPLLTWSFPNVAVARARIRRSEEHTSELQSLMRISYAVFCLKKKIEQRHHAS